jgi:hypothetical protein
MAKFSLLLLAAALVVAGPLARPARAMSVVAPSFGTLVARAEQIVRVQATAVNSRWDPAGAGQVIHTYVQFQVLRTLKGAPQNTLTLRLLGGQVGGTGMVIPDMPAFEVGATYILFVAQNGQAFCPLVGVLHGSYRVVADAATGTERVARANGEPLRAVADVILPIEDSAPPAGSVTSALPRDDFENAIIQEIGHAAP